MTKRKRRNAACEPFSRFPAASVCMMAASAAMPSFSTGLPAASLTVASAPHQKDSPPEPIWSENGSAGSMGSKKQRAASRQRCAATPLESTRYSGKPSTGLSGPEWVGVEPLAVVAVPLGSSHCPPACWARAAAAWNWSVAATSVAMSLFFMMIFLTTCHWLMTVTRRVPTPPFDDTTVTDAGSAAPFSVIEAGKAAAADA